MFERVQLSVILPRGAVNPHVGKPGFYSAWIDGDNGTLTIWGIVPNPDRVLVPGLPVTVRSTERPPSEGDQP